MNSIAQNYTFIAPIYDRVFNLPLSEGQRKIGKFVKAHAKKAGMKILEVGVGSGLTLNYLPSNLDFTGIDVNESMLAHAQKKAMKLRRKKIKLTKMDAHELEFRSNSFDMVIAPSVITSMRSPEEGMREMIRVTKKGGYIAVIANLRVKDSFRSSCVRLANPLTRTFLGYRTNLQVETFSSINGLMLIEKKQINSVLGMNLSWFLLYKKI